MLAHRQCFPEQLCRMESETHPLPCTELPAKNITSFVIRSPRQQLTRGETPLHSGGKGRTWDTGSVAVIPKSIESRRSFAPGSTPSSWPRPQSGSLMLKGVWLYLGSKYAMQNSPISGMSSKLPQSSVGGAYCDKSTNQMNHTSHMTNSRYF